MPALPFKLNQNRRHHIPEQKRKVTNWRDYDESLRRKRHVLTDTGDGRSRIDAVQEDSLSGPGNEPMMASPQHEVSYGQVYWFHVRAQEHAGDLRGHHHPHIRVLP